MAMDLIPWALCCKCLSVVPAHRWIQLGQMPRGDVAQGTRMEPWVKYEY